MDFVEGWRVHVNHEYAQYLAIANGGQEVRSELADGLGAVELLRAWRFIVRDERVNLWVRHDGVDERSIHAFLYAEIQFHANGGGKHHAISPNDFHVPGVPLTVQTKPK